MEIVIPKKLVPLVKAFSADEKSAKILIIGAAKAINGAEDTCGFGNNAISPEELESIVTLMQGIAPKDTIEMIYGAQIIASHIMGLRLLSHNYTADQTLGLKLLRFSNEAMIQLQKKKAGGINKNINITYNNAGSGPSFMQTVLLGDGKCL